MIDTNVLLHYPPNDDAARANIAANLIKNGDTVLITDMVPVEALCQVKHREY